MPASEILQNLIEHFSSENLIRLFRDKTGKFREITERHGFHGFHEFFSNGAPLGEIKLENNDEIVIYTFQTNNELTERSGKKAQYELAKKILKKEQRYSAGFFIFYDNNGNFRFSLIYDVPLSNGKREWSNFRRFTYYVSKDQTNKTFLYRLDAADFSSLEKIKEAFSVEKVTKEFYTEIANWYFWALDEVEFPDDEDKNREQRNAKNLIRLITRIIFVWFMKEKKLVPPSLFDKQFINQILNYSDKTGSAYYKAIIQNLFFATLNTHMKKDNKDSRIFVEDADKSGFKSESYLQQGYYRYNRFIKDKKLFLEQFENIPFLNGGLFECLDKKIDGKEIRIDCFSNNPLNETRLKVPDELFFLEKEKEANLSKYLGSGKNKKVKGLFAILKSYNFTIDENTPVDEEVALDPELLGKVFENLLASYNPETATTARKATGSYYTPREIVEYMVNESLIAYLKTKLNDENKETEERIRLLFDYNKEENPFVNQPETTLKIIDAIENIKILDPACGSGAFPMGILHKLVLALHKLDPQNKIWKKRLLDRVPAEIRDETERSLENKSLDYIRKLGLIEHCIYGVDIQEIAIQISKLRFFISLLVEQQIDDTKPNRDVRSLPNLETKFVAANTLIGLEKPDQMIIMGNEAEELEKQLFKLREEIFYTNSRWEKLELQKKEKQLREKLKAALTHSGFVNEVAVKIASWDPFDQNTHAEWFDPEWMFGPDVKNGFDLIIANPPYIQLQKDSGRLAKMFEKQNYQSFERTGDIYTLFYEKGYLLLKPNGSLCFITSNKWMRAGYGESLRKYLAEKTNPILLIDFAGQKIFEAATVDTNILLFTKDKYETATQACLVKSDNKNNLTDYIQENSSYTKFSNGNSWVILNPIEQRIKEKIEKVGKPLKDWDIQINYGIKTGYNEAFIIDGKTKDELIAQDPKSAEIIRPILRGRDIKRYGYEFADLWLIATFPSKNYNIDDYPAIKKHLLSFGYDRLKQTGEKEARKKTNNKWFETQDSISYWEDFFSPKIIYPNMTKFLPFVYDENCFLTNQKCFIITGNNIAYLTAFFNSSLFKYSFRDNFPELKGGTRELSKIFFDKVQVKEIDEKENKLFKEIVIQVQELKQQNKSSKQLEVEVDEMIFEIYDLTREERQVIGFVEII